MISQSTVHVRDIQLLILLSILRAEASFASCPVHGSHDVISMVFWNGAQCSFLFAFGFYWRNLSFLSCLTVLCSTCLLWLNWFSISYFFSFVITLSFYLQVQVLLFSCSGSEVRFNLLRTSFEVHFYLFSTLKLWLWYSNYFFHLHFHRLNFLNFKWR